MRNLRISLVLAIFAAILRPADSDVLSRGRGLYERRCGGCHSLDSVKVGPPLRGVFGRRAAADPKFPYSDGLKKANLVWDEPALDRWLADPDTLSPIMTCPSVWIMPANAPRSSLI